MTTSRSICLYGASDSGKTAQAGRFARYVYETTGKITRAVVTDQGGSMDVWQPYIEAGVLEPWYIGGVTTPLDVLHKLARGAWPVPAGDRLQWQEADARTWARVGAYIIDGGQEAAELIRDVSLRGVGAVLSQKPNYAFEEGDTKVWGSNAPYYGFAQDETIALIRKFNALPVERVLWTFGECTGEEETSRRPIYGPKTVGQATVDVLPKKFGDCLHLECYNVAARDSDGKEVVDAATGKPILQKRWRIFFQTHPDTTTGINYPAKPRIPPEMLPELLKTWPGGFLRPRIRDGELADGLDQFLRREAELLAAPVQSVGAWKARLDAARSTKNAPPEVLATPPGRIGSSK